MVLVQHQSLEVTESACLVWQVDPDGTKEGSALGTITFTTFESSLPVSFDCALILNPREELPDPGSVQERAHMGPASRRACRALLACLSERIVAASSPELLLHWDHDEVEERRSAL